MTLFLLLTFSLMHELFKRRRSHRKFLDKPVSDDQIKEILSAAMTAPCAVHIKTWEFVVVKDKETIAKISKAGAFQNFVKEAPCVIVIASEENNWWVENGSIVAGYIYLEATNQGLVTCWANIRDGNLIAGKGKESFVKEILGIPEKYRVLCMMPIGYPEKEIEEHSEKDYEEKRVHVGKW